MVCIYIDLEIMILVYTILLQITTVITSKTKSYINMNENNYITVFLKLLRLLVVSNFPSFQFSLYPPFSIYILPVCSSDGYRYQPDTTVTVKIGDNVTLKCDADLTTDFRSISWFHLKPPKHLQYIVGTFKTSEYDGFGKHFQAIIREGIHYLQILNTKDSDSGIYYCGAISGLVVRIGNGTSLDFEGIIFSPSFLCYYNINIA